MPLPRIAFLVADLNACARFRAWVPAMGLKALGYQVAWSEHWTPKIWEKYDAFIFQRTGSDDARALMVDLKHQSRLAAIIFDIDDNIYHIPFSNPASAINRSAAHIGRGLREAMHLADAIFTTTPVLEALYAPVGKPIFILPNVLDLRPAAVVKRPPHANDTVLIGWAGSPTHKDDVDILYGVLAAVASRFPQVRYEFIGYEPRWAQRQLGQRYSTSEIVSYTEYLEHIAGWDIGLAPVAMNRFNAGKSCLKFLDYAAVGLAVVATDYITYNTVITDGETGLLAGNSYKEWVKAISTLVAQMTLRERLAANARALVWEHWGIDKNAWRWGEAIAAVCRSVGLELDGPPAKYAPLDDILITDLQYQDAVLTEEFMTAEQKRWDEANRKLGIIVHGEDLSGVPTTVRAGDRA